MSYKYFKLKEFACKCGCNHNNINKELLDMLEQARKMAKLPFVITSGYRCKNHTESKKNPTSYILRD